MSEAKGGLFITFEPGRRELLQEAVAMRGRFSVELSAPDWPLERKEMFLVSLSENRDIISYAAIGRRKGGPRNTGAYNIEFVSFVSLPEQRLAPLIERLSAGARSTIKEREGTRGKWFPPMAWAALLEILKGENAQHASELNKLWFNVNASEAMERAHHVQRLALQRDAIGLSLDIAGLSDVRRQEFRKVQPIDNDTVALSFIALMDSQPPQERMLVDHDQSIMATLVAQGKYESATFSEGPRSMYVWTVDKGNIEHFAGIDLVILNRDYNSLLLIQYKCMEHEGAGSNRQWRYRPDSQFNIEIARMERVRALIKERATASLRMEDIRLNRSALYFKFCKRLPLSQQDGELADGMFMSLSGTKALLKSAIGQGPKGGPFIGYENCERYFNNSLFSALARDGWIGTRGLIDQHYKEVLGLIRDNEEADDRSLVLAETRTVIAHGAPRASRRAR